MAEYDDAFSSFSSISDDVWMDLDLPISENDDLAILAREEALDSMTLDISNMDFLRIEPPSHRYSTDEELLINSDAKGDVQQHQKRNCHPAKDLSGKAMRESSSDMDTEVSAQPAKLPFLSQSELNERMEQSVSRLAMSMKRSEMSRQKILQHGTGYNASILSTLIGASSSSTITSSIYRSRKVVGSYMNDVSNKTM